MSGLAAKRILVTGATGFLGRHLVTALKNSGHQKISAVGSKDYDLTSEEQTKKMYSDLRPEIVFHLAGLVGGNLANRERPADFFYVNLIMSLHTLNLAQKSGVTKFIALGSGCMYPEFAPMPLKEDSVWDGRPRVDSFAYSQAKRMQMAHAAALNAQHGFNCAVAIPGNAYGEFDNFSLDGGHVIPNLIRKFLEAKAAGAPEVEVWGTGEATRDYVYAGDVAKGLLRVAEVYSRGEVVNLSSGVETSIRELCQAICSVTGFKGRIKWLSDRPEGQKRRWFDVTKALRELDFKAETDLKEGLAKTVNWYIENLNSPFLRR